MATLTAPNDITTNGIGALMDLFQHTGRLSSRATALPVIHTMVTLWRAEALQQQVELPSLHVAFEDWLALCNSFETRFVNYDDGTRTYTTAKQYLHATTDSSKAPLGYLSHLPHNATQPLHNIMTNAGAL